MTVFVYVDTSKDVGDPDHIKIFANQVAAETWFAENDPEDVAFESRFWNEPPRNQIGSHLRDPCRSKFIRNEIQPRQEPAYSFPQD